MGLNKYTIDNWWKDEVNNYSKFVTTSIVCKTSTKIVEMEHTETFYYANLAVSQRKNIFYLRYCSYSSYSEVKFSGTISSTASQNVSYLDELISATLPSKRISFSNLRSPSGTEQICRHNEIKSCIFAFSIIKNICLNLWTATPRPPAKSPRRNVCISHVFDSTHKHLILFQ